MVRSLLGLSAVFLLSGAAHAWEHLDHESFNEAVHPHEHAVGAYLRSDDPGNAALEAEWNEAKAESSVPFFSVDCLAEGEHRVLCSPKHYDNANLPIISMLQHGELRTTYPGPRRASAILQWINRAKHRTTTQELTASSLSTFKTASEAACVAFLPAEPTSDDHEDGHPVHSALRQHWEYIAEGTTLGGRVSLGLLIDPPAQTVADESLGHLPALKCWTNQEMKVGHKSAAAAATAAIANNPYVKANKWLSREGSHASKVLSGPDASDAGVPALQQFIVDATRPVIGELTAENHEEYLNRGKPIVYIFASTEAERADLRSSLSKSAVSYAGTLSIVTVDPFALPELQQKLGLFDPTPRPVVMTRSQLGAEDDTSTGSDEEEEPVLAAPQRHEGAGLVAQPGKPVGVLVQLWSGNIWHYPQDKGFTVKELMGWGLSVKIGGVKPFRAADPEWKWPKKEEQKTAAAVEEEDRGRHDEL
ncbi:hypothetical protein Micbo1qcDRAFT_212004 [Microdochium bolleyi]|uniref:Thioredoxin domain-containing protein n=1 Tax=Microdochium bolleyi TaxID=196109 RepID=A0A136JKS6_9PEZI|nr:hypothetical protein Micbo1qcDRAFT_212004 [Microdochium bolleyi]